MRPVSRTCILRWLLPVLVSLPLLSVRAQPLQLNTTEASPYQVVMNGELSGLSVSILQCVFHAMDESYEIRLLPWARAVEDLRSQQADGIFTAMPASELDSKASLSYPFALEKWYWYSLMGHQPGKKVETGGIRSSNQVTWLEQQGIKASVLVNSLDQLVKLLVNGRIDRILVDERVMEEQLREQKLDPALFARRFSRYMPLGIYFSKRFLQGRPGFLTGFNLHMQDCAPEALTLNRQERSVLQNVVAEKVRPVLAALPLTSWLDQADRAQRSLTAEQIQSLDSMWLQEVASEQWNLIARVQMAPGSPPLRKAQAASAGLFTEVFLVSQKGLNVAQSQPTSDYYQADETFFSDAVAHPEQLYIGPISYDVSAHHFQVKVAWAVRDASGVRGVMAVGLDVEEALRGTAD